MAKVIPQIREENGVALEGLLGMIKDILEESGVVLQICRKRFIVDCKVENGAVYFLKTEEVAAVDKKFQILIIGVRGREAIS